jgi:pantetheine-phosphate adenylyltransferase
MATVLYPGSFDPIHLGHLDVIEQSAELFGNVVVAVMHNNEKPGGIFGVDERVRLITDSAADAGLADNVRVITHGGLAVQAAVVAGADFIVKGLRNSGDFEIEQQMALTNHSVTGVRSVYLPCRMDRGFISSRFVREIARYGGAVNHLVPGPVAAALVAMFPPQGPSGDTGSASST